LIGQKAFGPFSMGVWVGRKRKASVSSWGGKKNTYIGRKTARTQKKPFANGKGLQIIARPTNPLLVLAVRASLSEQDDHIPFVFYFQEGASRFFYKPL